MEPVSGAIKTASALSVQYGVQIVVCFVMIFIFGAILRWVFRFMDKLITETLNKVTGNLQSLTESNNSAHSNHILMFERISKDIKDGFDSLRDGNKFQREEHLRILDKIDDLEKNLECKAK